MLASLGPYSVVVPLCVGSLACCCVVLVGVVAVRPRGNLEIRLAGTVRAKSDTALISNFIPVNSETISHTLKALTTFKSDQRIVEARRPLG
jgi:hypothetical protein